MFVSFALSIDMEGVVMDACQVAPIALGYSRSQLIGSRIKSICPLLCDGNRMEEMRTSLSNGTPYDIKQNIFLTHDGNELPAQSHCIGIQRGNALAGYRMFNWVGKNS